ncbi:MAG: YihY/virulence factor BrkB family protein [Marmoricola sp.]
MNLLRKNPAARTDEPAEGEAVERADQTTPVAAPPEEHPGPEDYRAGPRRSPWFVARRTVREFSDDQGTGLAAELTYYSVLAIFPGMIALLALVGVFGQAQRSVDLILEILAPLVTAGTLDQLRGPLADLAVTQSAGITLIIGAAGALWSASGYVGAFSRGMNRIYEVDEGRPFWRMRPMQLYVTLVTVVLCALALVILIVSGPVATAVGNAIGIGDNLLLAWNYAKWPVLALIVMVIVAVLYHSTPNVAFKRFRIITVGAFFAIAIWLAASVGFAFYVANFSSYNLTYGSIAGVVVALLWLWLTNVALVFGAELDAELERGRELQNGLPAEETLQLPVRDRRGIEKAAARREKDVERQRAIRVAASEHGDPADRPFGRR